MVSPQRSSRAPQVGFTLIELLTVMAVMVCLCAMALPAVSNVTRGNQMNRNFLVLSGVFEQARQYAISKNTYVWVVLSPSPGGQDDSVKVGQIASMDGTDTLAWNSSAMSLPNSSGLEMVGKPQELRWASVGDVTGSNGVALANVNLTYGSPARTYTRAIQFTPTGEARVGASVARYIDLNLQDTLKSANHGTFRIAGLTGKTTVQRP